MRRVFMGRFPVRQLKVFHGLLPIAAQHIVMGQDLTELLAPVRVDFLHGPPDLFVDLLSALGQQAVVGDLLGEGMLEDVLKLREERFLMDELQSLKVQEM
ncbi:MAG: hypothetical protein JRJ09_18935, partial [Deltaproteobacteria bacterium]|nr:hypothetical protein [Deltaproteobacteria bacterium]